MKKHHLILVSFVIIICLLITAIAYLLINQPTTNVNEVASLAVIEESSSQESNSISSEASSAKQANEESVTDQELMAEEETFNEEYLPMDIERALGAFNYNHPETFSLIEEQAIYSFHNDFLTHQHEILTLLGDKNLRVENFGFAFLPDFPAQHTQIEDSGYQLDVPLLLQSDPRWARVQYGDPTDRMRQAGCALVSIAMVESYLEETIISPEVILNWAGQDYWVELEGTSWQIFEDYSKHKNWKFKNHGDDLENAMKAIKSGRVVIASILPGTITPEGHILVIRGYDPENNLVYVNDPNDDPSHMYSIQGLDEDIFINEAINYWSFG